MSQSEQNDHQICPECDSIRVKGTLDSRFPITIMVKEEVPSLTRTQQILHGTTTTFYAGSEVEAWVCTTCGLINLYATNPLKLRVNRPDKPVKGKD